VLVNDDRRVGRVVELTEWDLADGLWLCARCEITDPPEWLSKGTRASYAYKRVHEQDVGAWTSLQRALVTEVSILAPGREPAKPRASVIYLRRTEATPAGRIVSRGNGQVLRRPGLGQVLAIR
jgi:hypothetical protein